MVGIPPGLRIHIFYNKKRIERKKPLVYSWFLSLVLLSMPERPPAPSHAGSMSSEGHSEASDQSNATPYTCRGCMSAIFDITPPLDEKVFALSTTRGN